MLRVSAFVVLAVLSQTGAVEATEDAPEGGLQARRIHALQQPATRRRQSSTRDGPVRAFDCYGVTNPLQIMKVCSKPPVALEEAAKDVAGGPRRRAATTPSCKHAVMAMDTSTGESSKVFDVPRERPINGCQINPIDSVIYCVSDKYLVRFDHFTFRYVAKLAAGSVAGTFSPEGIFYYEAYGQSGLYRTGRLEELPDFEDLEDNGITSFSDAGWIVGMEGLTSVSGAQDLVFSSADLLGDGSKGYLITLNVLWRVIVVEVSTGKMWTLETDGPVPGKPTGFGSAWKMENRTFFAEDNGMGVFEVTDIDLAAKTATVSRVADSSASTMDATIFDGIQCPATKAPPAWSAETATVGAAADAADAPQWDAADETRRRRRGPVESERRRRRSPAPTEAPATTKPPSVAPGECLPGFVKMTSCSCQESVRCKRKQ